MPATAKDAADSKGDEFKHVYVKKGSNQYRNSKKYGSHGRQKRDQAHSNNMAKQDIAPEANMAMSMKINKKP